jgi:subtilisin-like proprotein convertase family protein
VFNADPGLAIPDGDPIGVSHTIMVGPSFTVGDVNVDLTVPHTWVGDLIVTVEHLGTTVVIIDRPGVPALGGFGCDQDNYNLIILDDEASDPIEDQCVPDLTSPPNYIPNEALSAFDTMNSAGAWTITVSDNAGFDEGTLDHWSLHIDAPGPSPCIPRGACCTSPTACAVTTEADCTGVYLGDGTDCESLGPVSTFEASPGLAIPDNVPAGVSSNIVVAATSGVFTIADVDVDLSVTHTWVGDLVVTITHGIQSVTIIDRPGEPVIGPFGCDQDNYDDIIANDEGTGGAVEDLCVANATSPPDYVPNNPLSAFDGMDATGVWTITISDNAGFDTGTLDHWSLHIAEPGPNPCENAFLGACCDTNGPDQGCTDDVLSADCVGPDKVYTLGGVCPPAPGGVVCNCIPLCTGVPVCGSDGCGGTCGVCTDGIACTTDACVGGACVSTPNDSACSNGLFCDGVEICVAGVGCTDGPDPCSETETCNEDTEECKGGVIPTVSAWGMVVMMLLLLAAGKVYFGHRRFAAQTNR